MITKTSQLSIEQLDLTMKETSPTILRQTGKNFTNVYLFVIIFVNKQIKIMICMVQRALRWQGKQNDGRRG